MIIIAHNIRSLHNVGAIFRNCAAFGIEKLYLTGITGTPPRKEIAKVALGAQDLVEWEQGEIQEVIESLKADGYRVYGLEQGEGAVDIRSLAPPTPYAASPIALVLGNEVEGIDAETIALLDGLVEIPMNKKRSLNVSCASAVAMHTLSNL